MSVPSAPSLVLFLLFMTVGSQREQETITGTIFCNNNASLYINGKLVTTDPVVSAPHNAFNVSFQVPDGEDITFAIDARDIANDTSGLELDNRCVGTGVLRATFSNGVVTNSSWKCYTWHYGPVNWKQCIAGTERPGPLKVFPGCFFNVSVDDEIKGCFSRQTAIPDDWMSPEFDDSGWEHATEWEEEYTRQFAWLVLPPNCDDQNTYISSATGSDGKNLTCPNNFDWGDSKFIWRPDLDLDNRVLCRYTLKQTSGGLAKLLGSAIHIYVVIFFAVTVSVSI